MSNTLDYIDKTCGTCFHRDKRTDECREGPPQTHLRDNRITTRYRLVTEDFPACYQHTGKLLVEARGDDKR